MIPRRASIGRAADRWLAGGSKPPDAAHDERERKAQQQHERAENIETLAHAPAIGNSAHERRDHDRGKSLAGLTQAYDCALLMAADCPRLHRSMSRDVSGGLQPTTDSIGRDDQKVRMPGQRPAGGDGSAVFTNPSS